MKQLGIRAHDLGCMSPFQLKQTLAHYHLDSVQLAIGKAIHSTTDNEELTSELASAIKAYFKPEEITVLSCYINPSLPNERERRMEIDRFKKFIAFASLLGEGICVGTETGSMVADCSFHPWNHSEEAFEIFLSSLAELTAYAKQFHVNIGIEPVVRHVVHSPKRVKQMLERVNADNLFIIYDPVNLLTTENYQAQKEQMEECKTLFGEKIKVIHLKDFVIEEEKMKATAVGRGLLETAYLLDLYPDCDYILDEIDKKDIPEVVDRLYALKYQPYFRVDTKEPFPIKTLGYTVYWENSRSQSFRRDIILEKESKCLVEYSLYFTYDIQHLYDLEHAFVEVNKNNEVTRLEGSFHGKYINCLIVGHTSWEHKTHAILYLQPGKHAVASDPDYFYIYPGLIKCCDEEVATRGLLVNELFKDDYETNPVQDEKIKAYLKKFAFIPTLSYVPAASNYEVIPFSEQKGKIVKDILEEIDKILHLQDEVK